MDNGEREKEPLFRNSRGSESDPDECEERMDEGLYLDVDERGLRFCKERGGTRKGEDRGGAARRGARNRLQD